MLPLANAARHAGHEIVFATGEESLPLLSSLRFRTHRAGIAIHEGFDELLDGAPRPSMRERAGQEVARRVFDEVLPKHTVRDLRPLCDEFRPDLLVYGQWDAGASVVAAQTGVPAVRHAVGRARPLGGGGQDAVLSAFGVTGTPGDQYLDIYPPSLQEPSALGDPRRVMMRPIPWDEPENALPDWVGGHPGRLIYLTLGSTQNDVRVLKAAIAGLSTVDADVLVALGPLDPAELGELGERVRVLRWVNQAALLRHVDLAVHHGGSGTMLGSLAEGVPQLVLPQRADQFVNAGVIAAAGLGLSIEPGSVTGAAVAAAAAELAAPAYHEAALATRTEIAGMPAPATVLSRLVACLPHPATP
jgi:UDP:flavonoid glycosyltransferase YjiC (YdhE family)